MRSDSGDLTTRFSLFSRGRVAVSIQTVSPPTLTLWTVFSEIPKCGLHTPLYLRSSTKKWKTPFGDRVLEYNSICSFPAFANQNEFKEVPASLDLRTALRLFFQLRGFSIKGESTLTQKATQCILVS